VKAVKGLNQKQFKAFLQLLKKDLIRIEQLEGEKTLKEELKQVIETIQIMIED
jgi:hypothetical protein